MMRIVPKRRNYRCAKCGKDVYLSEIEDERCYKCGHIAQKHKGCGGTIYEWDLDDIKIR